MTKKIKTARFIYIVPYKQTEGIFEKVAGYDVEIFDWIKTFVSKRHKSWVVFETTTGKNIAGGDTIDSAIIAAKNQLELYGRDKTLTAIAGFQKVPDENQG